MLTYNFSEFLKTEDIKTKGITLEDVENILKSILIDEREDGTYINEKGQYGIGILRGTVTKTYVAKFIGSSARDRYREELIE